MDSLAKLEDDDSMRKNGFALVELIVIMGFMAILAGIVIVNIGRSQHQSNVIQVVDILIADLRSQQTKAMAGATVNGVVPDGYGIYFETDNYTMFAGASYNPSEPSNAQVAVPSPVFISATTLSGNTVVFSSRNGEINGFIPGLDSITIANSANGSTNTIQLNQYGVVTSSE